MSTATTDTSTGQLLIGGAWGPGGLGQVEEVRSPYDGRLVGHAAIADASDADKALADYTGTLLLVTHDRRMLDAVAVTRRLAVSGGRVTEG